MTKTALDLLTKTRLLLIEDNPADARLIREALNETRQGHEFELEWVDRLQSGLSWLERQRVDLILLDLSLPDTQGLATLQRLHAQLPAIPVVVLTDDSDEHSALQALKLGAQDCLTKSEIKGRALTRSIRYALERSRSREALLERYRDLFENANDIVCTFDMDSRFTSTNRKAEEMLGYSREELLGTDIVNIASAGSSEEVLRALLSARERVSAAWEIELLTKAGEALPLEVSTRVIFANGSPVGIQGIFRDIRERKKFEAQLQQTSKMEALGRMAGGIAHDFNNLLTVITGYADLHLMALPRESEMRKQVVPILTASYRAADLTRQLLAFSRQQIIRPRILDPGSIVKRLSGMMPRLIGETIELKVQIGEKVGRIKGDPSQIEQVVMNLTVNARDAMPGGGKLTIEVANSTVTPMQAEKCADAEPGEYVMIAVSDTGTGMDEATQTRIFEPFFSTKKPGEGTGLGLAMVYGIVKQNRGFVWLQSDPGRGTTFRVYLPRTFADVSPDDTQTAREPRAGRETILVVENEQNVRTLIKTALAGWGYRVLIALNGEQALSICATHPGEIHLVISDLILPGMSGRELISRISQSQKSARFLVMSGYPESALAGHDELDPSMSFLQKPFAASQLSDQLWAIFET